MAKPTETPPHDPQALERTLNRRLAQAGCVVAFERAWPFLVLAIAILSLFLALAWSDLLNALPAWGKISSVFLLSFAEIAALLLAFRFGQARFDESVARLDRDSGQSHRPVATALDQPVLTSSDALTQALWRANQQAAFAQILSIKVKPPRPQLVTKDPYALRFTLPLLALAAYFAAGPERDARLADAFDWNATGAALQTARIDAWIDPPTYTHIPPVLIDLKPTADSKLKPFSVPVGSELVLRTSDPAGVTVEASAGLEIKKENANAAPSTGKEWRFMLRTSSSLTVKSGGRVVATIPLNPIADQPPFIEMTAPPAANEAGVTLSYRAGDDYGLSSGEAHIANPRMSNRPLTSQHRPLVPAPTLPLALPGNTSDGKAQTKLEPSESPWAGATVDLTLAVRDDANQEAVTPPVTVRLPQRVFTNSLARSLVEQRRLLALAPDRWPLVGEALRALLIAPDQFMPDAGNYLGLRAVETQLRHARTDTDLLGTVDALWQLALAIEDHEQGDEKKALDAARDALKKALENGAPPEEIKALTDRLKSALDAYLKAYAAKARKNQNEAGANRQPPGKMIRPEDLQAMIDQMNNLAKRGNTQDASQMLEALNEILNQLQNSAPQMADPGTREMNEALDELDQMMRDERALRDDTFRQGKGDAEGQSPQDQKSLKDRQSQLRDRLDAMRNRMKERGAPDQNELGEADDAMKNAEGAIGEGDPQGAIGPQGQAIESLRKGAQALAKSLEGNSPGNGQAKRPGGEGQQGEGGGPANDKDPLGRSTRQPDQGNAALQQGGKGGSMEKRSREVVEELRKRLGEPDRAPDELNYLRRLLERN